MLRPSPSPPLFPYTTLFRSPAGLDPPRHEIAHGGLGAPLTEGQVVLVVPALVTMPFDQRELVRMGLEPGGAGVQRPGIARADRRRVEGKVDRREGVGDRVLLGDGLRGRSWR